MLSKLGKALALLLFFYPVRWLLQGLPRRQALKLAAGLAALHGWFLRDQLYRQIQAGIEAVWPVPLSATARKQLVQRNLVTRYQHLVDGFFYRCLDRIAIEQVVPAVEGAAYLNEALHHGRGAILLVSHFGSLGLLIGGLALRGYRLHLVFTLTPQPQYRTWPAVERAIMRVKLQCWEHPAVSFEFWRPGMYLRALYRQLLTGTIVVLYGDGARGHRFTQVQFMGYPLSLSVGPFRIAARAQVPLIPAFIVREAGHRHRIRIEPPIAVKGDDPASVQQSANQYATLLAQYVRTYPDHWFTWARLRWAVQDGKHGLVFSQGEMGLYRPQETKIGAP